MEKISLFVSEENNFEQREKSNIWGTFSTFSLTGLQWKHSHANYFYWKAFLKLKTFDLKIDVWNIFGESAVDFGEIVPLFAFFDHYSRQKFRYKELNP